MPSVNKIILVGHLGDNPELRFTTGGKPRCKMSVATNYSYTDREGNRHEETDWHNVEAWGKQAETCNQYLTKGRQVYVEGRVTTRAYDDKQGVKRYWTEVVSDRVVFLGGRSSETPAPRPSPPVAEVARQPEPERDEIPF